MFVAAATSAVLFSWDVLIEQTRSTLAARTEDDTHWGAWLAVHLTAIAALAGLGWLAVQRDVLRTPEAGSWVVLAILLMSVLLASWAFAVMQPRFWFGWVRRSPWAFVVALTVGVVVRVSGFLTLRLWSVLTYSTVFAVALVLRLFGQQVILHPEQAIVGTARFAVAVEPSCSGLEGIALIAVITGAYLWIFRKIFRFPRALLLLPLGVAVIALLNVIRIASLVMVGQWWPVAAVEGFHSVAGWIFFNATTFGLIIVSRRSSAFRPVEAAPAAASPDGGNLAAAYLAPLLVMIVASMVTRIFSGGFDALYPIRVLAVGGVIWIYRGDFGVLPHKSSFTAIGLGAVAFLFWILLAFPHQTATYNAAFDASLSRMAGSAAAGWLIFRIAGAVITAPIAEELAFRGYVLRKLVRAKFETVSYRQMTWVSLIGSSALFAALHQQWLAAFVAGAIFAAAAYLSGRLSDAIVAHATTNALLALWVVSTHNWNLWN
jgi:exosortase E/protease (VPEID-CTERM system)